MAMTRAFPVLHRPRWRTGAGGVAVLAVWTTIAASGFARQELSVPSPTLARAWDAEHVSPPLPPLMNHAEVVRRLGEAAAAEPDLFAVEKIGESVEGRALNYVRI